MVKLKFYTQDMRNKEIVCSENWYYNELNDIALYTINFQLNMLKGIAFVRTMCLIENVEEDEV